MRNISVLLFLFLFTKIILATPDDGIRLYETVFGYNNEGYFCVQVIKYPTYSYYSGIDSAFVIERDFATAIIKSKTFINSRHHIDESSYGDWKTILNENEEFDFIGFLCNNDIKYLYPNIYNFAKFDMLRFILDIDGLKVEIANKFITVYELAKFQLPAPWIKDYLIKQYEAYERYPDLKRDNYVVVRNSYGDEKYIFISISGLYEPEHFQITIALERAYLDGLIEKHKKK